MRRARILAVTFALWTLLVWTTRIRNIIGDDTMERAEKVGRVGLALTFDTLSLALLVALFVAPLGALVGAAVRPSPPVIAALATCLAGWTAGVWLLQSGAIWVDPSHSTAFKAVHTGLAVLSVAFGAVTVWAVHRPEAQYETPPAAMPPSAQAPDAPDTPAPVAAQ